MLASKPVPGSALPTDDLLQSDNPEQSIISRLQGCLFRCLVDDDYTTTYVSQTVQALLGYPASDFIGHRVRSFTTLIHPDDLKLSLAVIGPSIEKNQPWNIDYRMHHARGDWVWVRESACAVCDAAGRVMFLEGVIIDIDERKRRELVSLTLNQDMSKVSADILKKTNGILATLNKLHMLGLNARIEAARAGQMGAGFAVVAQEINVLSNETMTNAKMIVELTKQLDGLVGR
jgi:PAS domain S-box-containing protein